MSKSLAGGGRLPPPHHPSRENPSGEGLDQNIYGGSYEPNRGITVVV